MWALGSCMYVKREMYVLYINKDRDVCIVYKERDVGRYMVQGLWFSLGLKNRGWGSSDDEMCTMRVCVCVV